MLNLLANNAFNADNNGNGVRYRATYTWRIIYLRIYYDRYRGQLLSMNLNLQNEKCRRYLIYKVSNDALDGVIMSTRTRYEIARKYYKDYVILILIKKKLYIYKNNILTDFKQINKLKELHINYIILDNLEVIERKYEDNKYEEYYLKYSLNNILDNILDKVKEGFER